MGVNFGGSCIRWGRASGGETRYYIIRHIASNFAPNFACSTRLVSNASYSSTYFYSPMFTASLLVMLVGLDLRNEPCKVKQSYLEAAEASPINFMPKAAINGKPCTYSRFLRRGTMHDIFTSCPRRIGLRTARFPSVAKFSATMDLHLQHEIL